MSFLCVPIFVRTLEQAQRDIGAAIAAGAEMIELRIDTLRGYHPPRLREIVHAEMIELRLDTLGEPVTPLLGLLKASGLPWILTCRGKAEGGHYEGTEESRLEMLRAIVPRGAPYLDLELDAASFDPGRQTRLILSSHDFRGRPERLYNILLEMDQRACDVKKVAWTARTVRDNLEAFEILQNKTKPTIALCMGEAGIISRILAKKFDAFLTFASLSDESATAPGQVSIAQMKGLYRWDKIRPTTKVYGVVAHPVGHSMSPAVHNAAFDATDYDGVYVPFLVNPEYESFKAFMESFVPFKGLDLSGLSVTLPHKENALRYLQETGGAIEELAARIGAVNTIVIDGPKLRGLNTDYAAILDSIMAALGCGRDDLSGLPVAVLGAGGTGRTAVAALRHFGATVTIFNRTADKAIALAAEFSAAAEPLENLSRSSARVYVNTTSVGMSPNVDQTPFGEHPPKLTAGQVVFDTIYNPMQTRLLKEAKAASATTVSGVDMFVHQAASQFAAWTKLPAPADVMRRVIERRLSA